MSARVLSCGAYATVAATGELYLSDRPRVYGDVTRLDRRRWQWRVTTGSRLLASGETRSRLGAWRSAQRTSQRPDILRGAR